MSKIINKIEQLNDGGLNPKSGVFESVLWKLEFEDNSEPRILGRIKMIEYLGKGTMPSKTVYSFKKWDLKTTLENEIRIWVIVYDDKSDSVLINKDFYALITRGHRNKDEEKAVEPVESTEIAEGSRGLVSAAVKQVLEQAQKEKVQEIVLPTKSITTPEEKEELNLFREQVIKNPYGELNN